MSSRNDAFDITTTAVPSIQECNDKEWIHDVFWWNEWTIDDWQPLQQAKWKANWQQLIAGHYHALQLNMFPYAQQYQSTEGIVLYKLRWIMSTVFEATQEIMRIEMNLFIMNERESNEWKFQDLWTLLHGVLNEQVKQTNCVWNICMTW